MSHFNEEEIPKHKKSRKKIKKPFVIEYKFVAPVNTYFDQNNQKWSVWNRYSNINSAIEAILTLKKKENTNQSVYIKYRFDKFTEEHIDKLYRKEK